MCKPKIIVVDRDRRILFAFRKILEKTDCQCIEINNPAEVSEKISIEKPQAVFFDLSPADSIALTALRQIKNKYRSLSVILIITSTGTEEWLSNDAELSKLTYLEKPFSIARVKEIIAEVRSRK